MKGFIFGCEYKISKKNWIWLHIDKIEENNSVQNLCY